MWNSVHKASHVASAERVFVEVTAERRALVQREFHAAETFRGLSQLVRSEASTHPTIALVYLSRRDMRGKRANVWCVESSERTN